MNPQPLTAVTTTPLTIKYGWPLPLCLACTLLSWFALASVLDDSRIVANARTSPTSLVLSIAGAIFLVCLGPIGCFIYSQRLVLWDDRFVVSRFSFFARTFSYSTVADAKLYHDRLGLGVLIYLKNGSFIKVRPTATNVIQLRWKLAERLGLGDLEPS